MIADYLDTLAGALRGHRSLSRRLREEVEEHLREAVAADPLADRIEAERHAIANFGDPYVIAAQFTAVSLAGRTRRVGVAIIVALAAIFITMKVRVALHAAMHWTMSGDMKVITDIAGTIDRYTFWLSVIVGVAGWAYVARRRVPLTFNPQDRTRMRRCCFACAAATGALILAVVADGVLTILRLPGRELSIEFVIPISSIAIEIGCAGILAWQIRGIALQTAATFATT